MGSSPKAPKPPEAPAARAIRADVVAPEDIILGTDEEDPTKKRGKRSLVKPLGTSASGLSV